jgi:lactate permease
LGITKSISSTIYPFVSPFIGGLGALLTGSNNNSNVLFGMMQKDTATLMGLSAGIILAAQTVGGSLGSVISPAKIIVGCSSVGISKREGEVLKKALIYILILIAITGLIALALSRLSIN